MSYSKSIAIALTTFLCATALAVDAGAQSRGRSGGRSSGGRGPSTGQAAPRGQGARTSSPRGDGGRTQAYRADGRRYGGDVRVYASRGYRAPLRSYYYPYYGYGYGYRPGFALGLSFGYPYSYGYYGYGYPYGYGYSYGGYYPAGYAGYGYTVGGRYDAYGGIRIQGAPRNAEVYVDGAYAGIVDDYDGVFQRLDLEPGSHEIEIRTAGRPLVYDVNVNPGQTVTIHANVR
ncbi:MAG: hypothetical protein JWL71_958 [Acidobacteria bacterium]|nr:hypothetical protein [Acidobacteriota bacterium]